MGLEKPTQEPTQTHLTLAALSQHPLSGATAAHGKLTAARRPHRGRGARVARHHRADAAAASQLVP